MNKAELLHEKQLVVEMSLKIGDLNTDQRKELLRLRCRTEFISYAKFITREVPANGIFKPYDVHFLIS